MTEGEAKPNFPIQSRRRNWIHFSEWRRRRERSSSLSIEIDDVTDPERERERERGGTGEEGKSNKCAKDRVESAERRVGGWVMGATPPSAALPRPGSGPTGPAEVIEARLEK